jgi:N-acetylmuramoyl-L-alanine amidase
MLKLARSIFALLLPLLLAGVSGLAAAGQVVGVAVQSGADVTRVVIELSAPARYTYQTLANPHRFVVDLQGVALKAPLDQRGGPVQRIRSGVRNGRDLRLVFDLDSAARPVVDLQGSRLVVDLQGGAPAPAVAAQPGAAQSGPVATTAVAPAAVPPAVKVATGQRDIVIAIDAGHGGKDPGAIGPGRVREKDVVLAIARELSALLARERGFKPVMIRSGDQFLPLHTRRDIARKAQADLFVSIHADAFTSPKARGASVFAISDRGATSTMAAFLAKSENRADAIGGVTTQGKDEHLLKVLTDLSMSASIDASMKVGHHVLNSMGGVTKLHSRRVEQAGFMVLKSPDTPSILVETGFISNPEEARKLATSAYQRQMAQAIFRGINRHFSDNPPPDTYLAWVKRNQRPVAEAPTGGRHTIAPGDTLSGIAQQYGVSLRELRQRNNLAANDTILVGRTLLIPPRADPSS